ncbi:MAG: DegT/DnrJ/EryC1/StrS family aminotransferase [Bacteroidetes bacterium]|nr:DegT/DnrJ/EryC1/StrS family aminotransferase [Bacteroidota bacterium]MDA1120845.1 DegT/DnrJ/EryC1/StrS family aminotransferase [Bacteroidota bacterium]
MSKKTISISQPQLGEEEWHALKEPLTSGWLTSGPMVKEFEEQFAKRHQVKHAVAVTSATTALHLSLVGLDIGPGDEVIVPAFTWVSTANVVLYCGAKVVFTDIDPHTFNIDPIGLKDKITSKTKAIICVHLFGLSADMDEIKKVSGDIALIEDAACAAGASYKGTPVGSLGTMACFSFHPRKSITTGEGGMITTNNDQLSTRLGILRNHGASISEEQRHNGPQPFILPDFNELGYNYRMTDLQGAVGNVQLKKLDKFINERAKWASYYNEQLKALDWLHLPEYSGQYGHGWQSYVTMVDETKSQAPRNEIMRILLEKGISTRPGTHAVHMLSYYAKRLGIKPEDFVNAKNANDFSMAIPLHNKMTEEDFQYVVNTLRNI